MIMPRRITHVFFDATDTLIRVRGSIGETYARLAASHGLHLDAQAIQTNFQANLRSVPINVTPGLTPNAVKRLERDWWHQVVFQTVRPLANFVVEGEQTTQQRGWEQHFDAWFEKFFDVVFSFFASTAAWELLPGVKDCLATLEMQGYRLGIISNLDSRLYGILEGFGIRRFFGAVHLAFEMGYAKPDLRLFAEALQHSKASANRSVHIGDSLRNDIDSATKAGMCAILFQSPLQKAWLPSDTARYPKETQHIRDFGELPRLLEILQTG